MNLKKLTIETAKVYKNTAEIKIEDGFLVNLNTYTGSLHPFTNGKEKIFLTEKQEKLAEQYLNDL